MRPINRVRGKRWTAKTQILQERWGANARRTSVRPPAPHFPAPKRIERQHKRKDDGREGAVSGRLARKATGVSPSGFARTGVLAEKGGLEVWFSGRGFAPLLLFFKREDDGREGAISGRLARKATGVSPSGFARTGVFAEKAACQFPSQDCPSPASPATAQTSRGPAHQSTPSRARRPTPPTPALTGAPPLPQTSAARATPRPPTAQR